ncbi:hypothetical protein [Leptolyngbya sp. FACHB-17]|uniref:hypothetical protein n=1 Tax=Leptolyngbya sp. FACHB-17 TaxID=2692803 RepID=UPI00199C8EE6|nr:hypothetical protein [Leptolyngbya sp. FACHB-17]MBD2078780.1 hypothetical protein [Leptolyngbya sp. FACHB-17]
MEIKRPQLSKTNKDTAMIIAMYVRNEMEDFHCQHLSDAQMRELNPIIRNAIATALYMLRNYGTDETSTKTLNFQGMLIPEYWEEPEIAESFVAL